MRGSKWKSLEERFWAKVDRSGGDASCWIWQASTRCGYGQFKVGGKRGRMAKAHRVAYEIVHGPIPDSSDTAHGTCVCHACDNPLCVNPTHLFLGSQRDNIRDRTLKGRTGSTLQRRDVVEIKTLLAKGVSQSDIARRFDVVAGTIQCIASGKTWRHVA